MFHCNRQLRIAIALQEEVEDQRPPAKQLTMRNWQLAIFLTNYLLTVFAGRFSHICQRFLSVRELIGKAFGQRFHYFAEWSPGDQLAENDQSRHQH
jgi:hypothetical protein